MEDHRDVGQAAPDHASVRRIGELGSMNNYWISLLFLACNLMALDRPSSHRLADSLQLKLNHLQQNAIPARPDPAPTTMTEEEVNDYFASGRVNLPQGVKKVTFEGRSG